MPGTPVVLIAFNRPDETRRTFAAIREARPQRLFLVCDGPREDRPDDTAAVAAVRALFDDIDWPCDVDRHFRERNLGVEANIELGLDRVFSMVDRAIVIEDDCQADSTFFRFADQLLDRYDADRRVWQVAGNGLGVAERLFHGSSYAFSAWASVWGWATWADRWRRHRERFPRTHLGSGGDAPLRTAPVELGRAGLVTSSGRRHFLEAAVSGDVVTHGWDKHWWLTIMSEGGVCVTPSHSLVENIGFGEGATHTVGAGVDYGVARPMAFPLVHPPDVVIDAAIERELELILNRVGGRAARVTRRLVRSRRIRRVLRSVADSRAATGLARTLSRMSDRSPG